MKYKELVAEMEPIANGGEETEKHKEESKEQPKVCPRCGGNLVLRTAKKGKYEGNQFYGCSNFPKCRYTLNL